MGTNDFCRWLRIMDWCLFSSEDASIELIQVLIIPWKLMQPCDSLWHYGILISQAISWDNASLSKPIRDKLYIDPQIADIRQLIYPLHSYIPTEQFHRRHYFFLDTKEMGPTKIDNFQYCGKVFPFCSLKQCKIN